MPGHSQSALEGQGHSQSALEGQGHCTHWEEGSAQTGATYRSHLFCYCRQEGGWEGSQSARLKGKNG